MRGGVVGNAMRVREKGAITSAGRMVCSDGDFWGPRLGRLILGVDDGDVEVGI